MQNEQSPEDHQAKTKNSASQLLTISLKDVLSKASQICSSVQWSKGSRLNLPQERKRSVQEAPSTIERSAPHTASDQGWLELDYRIQRSTLNSQE